MYDDEIYEVGDYVDFRALMWSSDWNGDEVGYPEIEVVGLYADPGDKYMYYVNSDTGEVLDVWTTVEDDE